MIFYIKLIIFIAISFVFLRVSHVALRNIRCHGFYRFFAWELILILFLINIDLWFYNPFSFYQIISWFLLFISTLLGLYSILLFIKLGKLDKNRDDPSLFSFEKTTKLVKVGIYRYIRHPMYSSLIFLNWGIFFKEPALISFCFAIMATFFLIMTSKMEEAENLLFFGDEYQKYMKQTKMFIPFLF